jgi:hypothetical protein
MNLGLVIYGYDKDDAERVHKTINEQFDTPLFLKSATGKENETIKQIIYSTDENEFENKKTKIIMFVNITNDEIQQVLQTFPQTITRPIFCGLTKHNISWSFSDLKIHLLEEQAYWEKQKKSVEKS